jgi:hypothetical protein
MTCGGGDLADYAFIPSSLLKHHKKGYITKHGTEGIHYACGWISLAKMLKKYGENYSPLGPLPEPDQSESEKGKKRHPEEEKEEEDEGNAIAVANPNVEEAANQEIGVGHDDTAVDANSHGANVDNNAQENNEEEGNHPPPDNASLSVTLECLRKCRNELTWLGANPDFHEENDTEDRQDLIGETINILYDQISRFNDANSNNSETG